MPALPLLPAASGPVHLHLAADYHCGDRGCHHRCEENEEGRESEEIKSFLETVSARQLYLTVPGGFACAFLIKVSKRSFPKRVFSKNFSEICFYFVANEIQSSTSSFLILNKLIVW